MILRDAPSFFSQKFKGGERMQDATQIGGFFSLNRTR